MTSKTIFEVLRAGATLGEVMSDNSDTVPALVQSGPSTEQRHRIDHIEDRLDKLALVNMAMWSLIRQHTGLTEEDLMQRVQEIDLIDGRPDGKVTRQVMRCQSCKRVMSPRHSKCLYCGAAKLELTAFDAVV